MPPSQPCPSVVVTTVPFGAVDPLPLSLLRETGVEFLINPLGRKLQTTAEVIQVIGNAHVVIAGTENITREAMAACPSLRGICRVGIGLDSVDLIAAREREIAVSYTPDAPSAAVAELTVGLMLDLLRQTSRSDRSMRAGRWSRFVGRRLAQRTVGILGVGRIGRLVAAHLKGGFPEVRLLAHDIAPTPSVQGLEWVDFSTLLQQSDIVTVHVPLTPTTHNMIDFRTMSLMKPGALLINTARGGIVNEIDLAEALVSEHLAGAAVDVFETEPYAGPLTGIDTALLTAHQGSMTDDCRARMEIEATREALRILAGQPLASPAPEEEYRMAAAGV